MLSYQKKNREKSKFDPIKSAGFIKFVESL